MRKPLLSVLLMMSLAVASASAQTHADVETPAQRDARMAWWREAKFGMFIHWGVYSVPAGVYEGKHIGGIGEWIMNDAKIPMATYQTYAKQFNPVKFDADAWVKTAKAAGMKYIVITSKHHDGFAMFDSKASDWNIVKATPFDRDPLKELAAACRKQGIKLGFYYSQAQDWNNGGSECHGRWDPAQEHNMDDYIDKVAVPQVREILSNYGEFPAVLWWDTPCGITHEEAKKLHELLELKPGIIQNNRLGGGYDGDTETPEQHIPATGFKGRDWETCMTMNGTWGFKTFDQNWKSTQTLVRNLIDIASKGGNYLLNVGPTSEGLIPDPSIERLREVGAWMKINGEAIYGTKASPFARLPFPGRCTQKEGRLYLHLFDRPDKDAILLPISNKVEKAYLLSAPRKKLSIEKSEDGVVIKLPADYQLDPFATVVAVKIKGQPQVLENFGTMVRPEPAGTLTLGAADAQVIGGTARLEKKDGDGANIGYWIDPKDKVQWEVKVAKPGTYNVELTFACEPDSAGSEYEIIAGDEKLTGKVTATQSWADFATMKVGSLKLTTAGKNIITVKPVTKPGVAVMNLRSLVLRPE